VVASQYLLHEANLAALQKLPLLSSSWCIDLVCCACAAFCCSHHCHHRLLPLPLPLVAEMLFLLLQFAISIASSAVLSSFMTLATAAIVAGASPPPCWQ